MRRGKIVTSQTLIGEKGIALIAQRCLEMGYLFHPRRVDHGIDGHIDLVDAVTQELLNLTVLVQSKAQDRPFPGETAERFHYVCEERDLDLWLAGNAPVVLILSHPDHAEAWWVDVKSAFPDAATRSSRTVHINKGTQLFDRGAAPALMRMAQSPNRGLYLRPPAKHELLTTNLLSIDQLPDTIYFAPSVAHDYRGAGEILASEGKRASGWMLRDGRVYSFIDLRQDGFRLLWTGDVNTIPTKSWAFSDDGDTMYRFTDLLSRYMNALYPELRWHNERHHLHFKHTLDFSPRKAGKRPGTSGRTVFAPHFSKSDPARVSYYHHAALRTRFRRISESWYCQLEPDYCFTYDGVKESSFADSLLAGIKRLDHHSAVAGWTKMWATYLRREPDLFSGVLPLRFGSLVAMEVDRGIDDKWWGPAPSGSMTEYDEEDDASISARVGTASPDADMSDLLTLITGADLTQPSPTPHPGGAPNHRRRSGQRRGRPRMRGRPKLS
ncbi:MAG: DUF4365 domain-containing protein [Actinomycetota bacterium]|nr:DUF4365 domain-containing protein [Actinomycetota bacterium]